MRRGDLDLVWFFTGLLVGYAVGWLLYGAVHAV